MKTILFVVKSIDGGTGKYIESLQWFNRSYVTKTLVLEKPSYRKAPKQYLFLSNSTSEKSDYFNMFSTSVRFARDFRLIGRQIDRIQPTVVFCVDIYANIIVLLYKLIFRKKYKVIITTHTFLSRVISQKTSWLQKNVIKLCIRFLYFFADKIIAVSQGVKDDLMQYFRISKTIDIINNGVAKPHSEKKTGDKKYNGIIVSIGRLVEQKDFHTLILAFKETLKTFPSLRLWIIGDGPLKSDLITLTQTYNISEKVRFFGWKQNVNPLLCQGDLFVLSSRWEGFPYVLIEAMSHGIPIVATDSPHGVREILGNGTYGRLVDVGDVHNMSKEIVQFAESDKLRLLYGRKSENRSERFTIEKMRNHYSSIFSALFLE